VIGFPASLPTARAATTNTIASKSFGALRSFIVVSSLPKNQTVYLSYEPVHKACAALQPARIATVHGQRPGDADEDVRICNKLSGTVS